MNHRHHAAVKMLLANGVPFLHTPNGKFAKPKDTLDEVPRPLGWAKALNECSICPCSVFLWHRFFPWTCGSWEPCKGQPVGADYWWSRDWWQPCPTCARCPYAYTEYGAFDHASGWRWWRMASCLMRRAPFCHDGRLPSRLRYRSSRCVVLGTPQPCIYRRDDHRDHRYRHRNDTRPSTTMFKPVGVRLRSMRHKQPHTLIQSMRVWKIMSIQTSSNMIS